MRIVTAFATGLAALMLMAASAQAGKTVEIKMLNKDPDNPRQRMVFSPRVVKVQPGDTVKFVPADKGHFAAATKGMIPDGTKRWRGKINKEFEVTLDKPGVYGYQCPPHVTLGMVGMIIVEGEGMDANLAAAKKVKQRGKARLIYEQIFAEAEKLMTVAEAAPAEAAPAEAAATQ